MAIRLVAVDLDGTLLDSNKRLTVRTYGAVERAHRLGVQIVIASARPPRTVQPLYDRLGLQTPQIAYNGAMVWHPDSGEVLMHRPLTPEAALAVIRMARSRFPRALVAIDVLNQWHTDRYEEHYTESGPYPPTKVGPLEEIVTEPVTRLMLLADADQVAELEELLVGHYGEQLAIAQTDERFVQVMHPRAGKTSALAAVAEHYGLDRSEVMAIGDALNDLGMIQWAGTGVAVHNAHPRVRQAADFITSSNDEDGVAEAMDMFVLGSSAV